MSEIKIFDLTLGDAAACYKLKKSFLGLILKSQIVKIYIFMNLITIIFKNNYNVYKMLF